MYIHTQMLRQQAELMSSRAAMLCCNATILLVIALLAVARIQGAGYSVFIIFIPLFIIVSPSHLSISQISPVKHSSLTDFCHSAFYPFLNNDRLDVSHVPLVVLSVV